MRCKVSTAYQHRYSHTTSVEGVRVGCASARTQHPRAFIRDAISAPIWYRPSRAPQTPPVHPCTDGSPHQDLNNEKKNREKNKKIRRQKSLLSFHVERTHFRAASRDAGGRLRAHRMCAPRPVGQTARSKARELRVPVQRDSHRTPTPVAS